mmetsp:Transcript_66361/g.205476  ORF Transcript_66361/g.205476 Transcript_66361/m.205476 type:complete len:246 (-) Transcript_66361:153-890(-)
MYLIFSGIGECCKLPGKACGACGDLCKQMNCTACRDCFKGCASGCSGFVEKPLSSFVVITIIMSLAELGYLATTFSSEELKKCTLPKDAFVSITGWITVEMLFSLLNLVFAPYFQYRVWERLYEESEAESKLQSMPVVEVEKDVVQSSFKYVFMHDFGVCFYFMALIASFAWSAKGFTWVTAGSKECNPDGGLSFSANLGWAFFWIAILYVVAWYCCGCCAKATTIRGGYEEAEQEEEDNTKPFA